MSRTSSVQIRLGNQGLDLSFDGQLLSLDAPHGELPNSLNAAVEQALSAPLDFPPLDQATVPGDMIALAVDHEVPQISLVTKAVIDFFTQRGTPVESIAVVVSGTQSDIVDRCQADWTEPLRSSVKIEQHMATDMNRMGYLAASEAALPMYVNRTLLDADLVVPITCGRAKESLTYVGPGGIFPQFTDTATRHRFRTWTQVATDEGRTKNQRESKEATWLMGIQCIVQVLPGSDGSFRGIVAGVPEQVEIEVDRRTTADWETQTNELFPVVLAIIDGGASEQTWDNIARAAATSLTALAPGGTLILISSLNAPPGKSIRRLASLDREENLDKRIANDDGDDALAAAALLNAIRSGDVYLLSELEEELVEDLGMGAIASLHGLQHLIQQFDSGLVIHAAQYQSLHFKAS